MQGLLGNLSKPPKLKATGVDPLAKYTNPASSTKSAQEQAADKAGSAARAAQAADDFTQAFPRSSTLRALRPNGALDALLPLLHRDDGVTTILALDFDQTLTEPRPVDQTRATGSAVNHTTGATRVRGGERTVAALRALAASPSVELIIVTAAAPSVQNARTVARDARHVLGLGDVFDVEDTWPERARAPFDGALDDSLDALRLGAKLVTVLASARESDRVGADLWRIDGDSVEIDDGVARFRTRAATTADATFDALGALSAPQTITDAPTVACLKAYRERTAAVRAPSSPLLLACDDTGEFCSRPMAPSAIAACLAEAAAAAALAPHEEIALLHGDAVVVDAPSGGGGGAATVPVAVCGRVHCASYNKAEAVRWFAARRGLRPAPRVVFVDDAISNVFSIFSTLSSDASFAGADAVWFPPPPHGKAEFCADETVRAIVVRGAALHPPLGGVRGETPPPATLPSAEEDNGRVLVELAAIELPPLPASPPAAIAMRFARRSRNGFPITQLVVARGAERDAAVVIDLGARKPAPAVPVELEEPVRAALGEATRRAAANAAAPRAPSGSGAGVWLGPVDAAEGGTERSVGDVSSHLRCLARVREGGAGDTVEFLEKFQEKSVPAMNCRGYKET